MSLFSRLFGGGASKPAPEVKPEEYEGFAIYPEPEKDGGRWRVAARIEKQVDGETLTHMLIRADVLDTPDAAVEVSISKARQVINEQGERLFR